MARTRLRGIELAGMRLAVEAPPGFQWDWPTRGLAGLAAAPVDADVYVGASIGFATPPEWEPITYAYDGGTFDVGLAGEEWWVVVHGTQRFERVARFDRTFSEGEVTIAPGAVANCRHPLDGPLLDLLLTHRLIGDGGLVLAGSAVVMGGRALALLSDDEGGATTRTPASGAAGRKESERTSRTPGRRFGVRMCDGAPRIHGLPGSHGHPGAAVTGRLDAIHLMTRSDRMFAAPIDRDEAVQELLQHACAPVHAPDMADQMMRSASVIGRAAPMLRIGVPEERRVVPFDWGRREAAHGFALPGPR